jgi:hypothetical protein
MTELNGLIANSLQLIESGGDREDILCGPLLIVSNVP